MKIALALRFSATTISTVATINILGNKQGDIHGNAVSGTYDPPGTVSETDAISFEIGGNVRQSTSYVLIGILFLGEISSQNNYIELYYKKGIDVNKCHLKFDSVGPGAGDDMDYQVGIVTDIRIA